VIARGDGRDEISLESPASAGLFHFRRASRAAHAVEHAVRRCRAPSCLVAPVGVEAGR
jgi:hypothetical protein